METTLINPERIFPTYRQSLLGTADNCLLSALFSIQHDRGWSGHAQARGIMAHRAFGEILKTLKRQGERQMPTEEAMVVLREVLEQRGIPDEDVVRVPTREQKWLRVDVLKFATAWEWDPRLLVDVERRLFATVAYEDDDGSTVERTVTGQLDALLAEPPDGAVVVDHKAGWAIPPKTPEDAGEEAKNFEQVSYRGWWQQRLYSFLVMRNFPAVNFVRFRELWPRYAETRTATMFREDLEHVEYEIVEIVRLLDRAIAGGLDPEENKLWKPSPGKHCGYCLQPSACPISAEARGEGAIPDEETARRYAAEYVTTKRLTDHRTKALKAWIDEHGPQEVEDANGRLMVGWRETPNGRRFGAFVPSESDRGAAPPDLPATVEAMA